jgi:serine/threonine-protein kinase
MAQFGWTPGAILLGKYRVERILGQGGMGVVVEAIHTTLDDRVAIKFLLPEGSRKDIVFRRFLQEARAAARIKSEHVAKVFDVGTLESGEPYMIMECLKGSDLERVVEEQGPLPLHKAADCIVQACDALAHAHALGIIHRDIKPANLFLCTLADGSPSVKLLDFGISKATLSAEHEAQPHLTESHTAMGTPYYMSPEQMKSAKRVDARSDIWSLGVTLFQLLAGVPPFQGETLPEVCSNILTEPPRSLRSLRPEVPLGLEAIVLRCLERKPDERYQSVAELAQALEPFCSEVMQLRSRRIPLILGVSSPAANPDSLPAGVVQKSTPPEPDPPPQTGEVSRASGEVPRASPRGLWLALGLALVLAGALGINTLRGTTTPSSGLVPTVVSAVNEPPSAPQPLPTAEVVSSTSPAPEAATSAPSSVPSASASPRTPPPRSRPTTAPVAPDGPKPATTRPNVGF